MLQLVVAMFVLLLLWGTVWYLKRKGLAMGSATLLSRRRALYLESLDKMRLSPQHSVHLLRVENRKILVAVHPGGITVLSETAELRKGAAQC